MTTRPPMKDETKIQIQILRRKKQLEALGTMRLPVAAQQAKLASIPAELSSSLAQDRLNGYYS